MAPLYSSNMLSPPWVVACRLGEFEWTLEEQWEVLGEQDDAFAARLEPLSGRAQTAFSLGCAEWVVRAAGEDLDVSRFRPYLASRWLLLAGEVEVVSDVNPRVLDAADVPISVADAAVAMIEDTYFGNGDGHYDCALASMLAIHVLADSRAFETWQEHCIAALARLHPGTGADWNTQAPVYIDELGDTGPEPGSRPRLYAPLRIAGNPFVWTPGGRGAR
jgi:hypothetical protein